MTLPNEVNARTVLVEGIAGNWHVVCRDKPIGRYETRAEALAKAREMADEELPEIFQVIVTAAPGPFYK